MSEIVHTHDPKLEPCPKCGSTAVSMYRNTINREAIRIVCHSCNHFVFCVTKYLNQARVEWNARVKPRYCNANYQCKYFTIDESASDIGFPMCYCSKGCQIENTDMMRYYTMEKCGGPY